jgi:lactate permease
MTAFTDISFVCGIFFPLVMVALVIFLSGGKGKLKALIEISAFCLFTGIVYFIPWILTALYLGPELPSIIGAIVGLPIFILFLKMKWLVPKHVWDFPENEITVSDDAETSDTPLMPAWKAWLPYIMLSVLLLLIRNEYLPFREWFKEYGTFYVPHILHVENTDVVFNVLYNPGFFPFCFIAGFLICKGRKSNNWKIELKVVWSTAKQLFSAGLAIFMAFAMVQLMIFSAYVNPEFPGMLTCIASELTKIMGSCYLIAAQFLGVFGSFFGGSCTVSNILFASLQFHSAQALKLPADVVLALQNTGSGLGGMIRISGVIASCAAVKIGNKTGDVLLLNLIPLVVFSILTLITALFCC